MPANPCRASLVPMYAKCTMVHERGTVPETRETIAFAGFFLWLCHNKWLIFDEK